MARWRHTAVSRRRALAARRVALAAALGVAVVAFAPAAVAVRLAIAGGLVGAAIISVNVADRRSANTPGPTPTRRTRPT